MSIQERLSVTTKQLDPLIAYHLIHHSDRGVQYYSSEYITVLYKFNISISMTQTGSPYENALAERVNGTIKNEFYPKQVYRDYQSACLAIGKIIDLYNGKRPHGSIDFMTPDLAHQHSGPIAQRWKKALIEKLRIRS